MNREVRVRRSAPAAVGFARSVHKGTGRQQSDQRGGRNSDDCKSHICLPSLSLAGGLIQAKSRQPSSRRVLRPVHHRMRTTGRGRRIIGACLILCDLAHSSPRGLHDGRLPQPRPRSGLLFGLRQMRHSWENRVLRYPFGASATASPAVRRHIFRLLPQSCVQFCGLLPEGWPSRALPEFAPAGLLIPQIPYAPKLASSPAGTLGARASGS